MFVKNYLMTFFLPIFKRFTQIILEASKNPFDSIIDFYRVNEKVLEEQLHRFVE